MQYNAANVPDVRYEGEKDHDIVAEISCYAKQLATRSDCITLIELLKKVRNICKKYARGEVHVLIQGIPIIIVKEMQAMRTIVSSLVNKEPFSEYKEYKASILKELKFALGELAKAANEIPHYEMDALGEPLMAIASGFVSKGIESFSGELKKAFGVDHDSRSIVRIDADNFATVNTPREVLSTAFKAQDRAPDQVKNYSQEPGIDVCDLKSRMMLKSRLNLMSWAKSAVVGTDLLAPSRDSYGFGSNPYAVQPWEGFAQLGAGGFIKFVHTAPSAVAAMYRRWRGAIEFTIEPLPTRFHQGQLYVAFQPWNGTGSDTVLTLADARNCIGATIDLSTSNRTSIIIPFNSTLEYLEVPTLGSVPTFTNSLGRLQIFVQNPLVGPETVSDTIDVNLWINVCEDFEYAVPKDIAEQVEIDGVWQMAVEQIEVDGEWQMNYSEVIQDVKVMAPVIIQPTGSNTSTDFEVTAACNVIAADLTTVTNREYLLATGVIWTTSATKDTLISSLQLTTLFRQQSLAIRGLLDYHNYFRGDFEITLKMNANPFMCGMLALSYTPADRNPVITATRISEVQPTLNQKACGFYTPATDTSVTIRIPWTNLRRIVRTADFTTIPNCLGSLQITVYNQLRTGTGGPTQLTGSLWGRVVQPYIGFKRGITGSTAMDVNSIAHYEMDPPPVTSAQSDRVGGVTEHIDKVSAPVVNDNASSDTQTLESTGGRPIPALGKKVSGFIQSSHMNVKELLRRPDHVTVVNVVLSETNKSVFRIPVGIGGVGKVHKYLRSSYHAWSGTMRFSIIANTGHTQEVMLAAIARFDDTSMAISPVVETFDWPQLYDGSGVWRPALEGVKMISVPFYPRYPTLYTMDQYSPPVTSSQTCYNGTLEIVSIQNLYLASAADTNYQLSIFQSVGDDYELYIPLPFAATRRPQTRARRNAEPVGAPSIVEQSVHVEVFPNVPTVVEGSPVTVPSAPEGVPAVPVDQTNATHQGREEDDVPDHSWDGHEESVFRKLEFQVENVCSQLEHQGGLTGVKTVIQKLVDWIKSKIYPRIIAEFSDKVRDAMQIVMTKVLPAMTWILDFLVNVHVICTSWDATAKMMALTALTTKCLVAYSWGEQLLKQLNEVIDTHFQGGSETYTVIAGTIAAAVVAGVIGLMGYGLKKSDSRLVRDLAIWKFAEGGACISKLASGAKAIPALWLACKTGIETAISYILEGRNVYTDWFTENSEKLQLWQSECDDSKIQNMFDNNNLFKLKNYERLERLTKFAREVRIHGPGVKLFPQIYYRTADMVLDMAAKAEKSFVSALGRVEPVGMFIEGEAGCGKSYVWTQMMPFFVMKEAGLVKNREEAKRQFYSKPSDPNQTFLDGYMSQRWMNCDDFMAGTEDKDALQMINYISVAACPVNMADISEKRTIFDSVFICATTNQKCVNIIGAVRDKPAIIRRFPISYHMDVKEAFRLSGSRKCDMSKMLEHLEKAGNNRYDVMTAMDDVWSFRELNLATGAVLMTGLTVREMVTRISDLYKERVRIDTSTDEFLGRLEGFPGMRGNDFVTMIDAKPTVTVPVEVLQLQGKIYKSPNDTLPKMIYNEEQERIKLGKKFFESASEMDAESELNEHVCLRYFMAAWKLQQIGELSRYEAQNILRVIRHDIRACGFHSWISLEELASSVELPPSYKNWYEYQRDPMTYISDCTLEKFARFCVMLSKVKDDIYAGPPKKKWEGVALLFGSIVAVGGGLLFVSGVIKMCKMLLSKVCAGVTSEGPAYDKREPHRVAAKAGPVPARTVQDAMQHGLPASNDMIMSVQRAMRKIRVVTGEKKYSMNCLAIDCRNILVPWHFYNYYVEINKKESSVIELEHKDKAGNCLGYNVIRMDTSNTEKLSDVGSHPGNRDCVLVRLIGAVCANARNIRPIIITRKERAKYTSTSLEAVWLHPDGIDCVGKAVVNFAQQVIFKGDSALPARTADQSVPGDCGRPYVIRNSSVHHPLVGFHVLGFGLNTKQTGVCDVSIESIQEAEETISARMWVPPVIEPWAYEDHAQIEGSTVPYWDGSMEVVGKVSLNGVKLERNSPDKTAFCRTNMQHVDWLDEFLPTEKNQIKVGGKIVHPLYTNVQKYRDSLKMAPPISKHRIVVEYMKNKMGVNMDSRPLDLHETINGFGSMSPLVMSTSCGYIQGYYNLGKTELFTALPQQMNIDGSLDVLEYEFSDVAKDRLIPIWGVSFCEHYRRQQERIKCGEAIQTFWVATNKDELVSRLKVKNGKTRVFLQPGLETTLLTREYFGYFTSDYKNRAGFNLCHGIGKDKEAVWKLYREIFLEVCDNPPNGFDIDYENYDGTGHGFASEAFLEVVDNYYHGQWTQERAAILDSIVNSQIICGREVIAKSQGNCSGSPITDVYNSITNWYNVLYVYLISRDISNKSLTLEHFDDEVRCLTYGDDVVCTASNEVLQTFNRVLFKEVMDALGMSVTSAAKDGTCVPYESFDNLTFLKSPFVVRDDYVVAPLPLKVVHRELRWQKKINDGDALILKQKVDAALAFAAHHGEESVRELLQQLHECGYDTLFNFKEWEWRIRNLQEMAKVDRVWSIENPADRFFILSDDKDEKGAFDFDCYDLYNEE